MQDFTEELFENVEILGHILSRRRGDKNFYKRWKNNIPPVSSKSEQRSTNYEDAWVYWEPLDFTSQKFSVIRKQNR